MAVRPLIFGVLFVAIFVLVITSILWVNPEEPTRQPPPAMMPPPVQTAPPPSQ
ncbi:MULTISPECIES: hypothetical protein [unclassified Sinorhizobium]|uniref:hypothetical protein n=1 Tax=unclassified Sinorhizobium TaxID=2613772 RepID=UPI003523902A